MYHVGQSILAEKINIKFVDKSLALSKTREGWMY